MTRLAFGISGPLPGLCTLKPEWSETVDRTLVGPWIASLNENRWDEVEERF